MVVFQSLTLNHARTHDSIINLGPYALRHTVNKFSSSALGKINKFLLRSFTRQFTGSSSVNKFSSFALGKTNKFLLLSLVPRFPHTPKMMGFLGIGNNPMVGATVAIAVFQT